MSQSTSEHSVGLITIGQSPRVDMVPEMIGWLGPVRPLERGALDGLTAEQIEQLSPTNGDYALVTRLRDGSSATIAEHHILPRLQAAITDLEGEGSEAVILLCTGEFPRFEHARPLLTSERLLVNGVKAIAQGARVGVICPLPEQIESTKKKWTELSNDLHVVASSPYGDLADLRWAASRVREFGAEYVVLDCMGYTQEMKEMVREEVGVPVLLARSVVARLASEVVS
jgi:protein AroM